MDINICFTTDNNYIRPLCSTMASILKNIKNETSLHIFILEHDVSDENKNKILSLKDIKDCEISFVKINISVFDNFPDFQNNYITKTAYFRFLVADLLKNVDKILYLDCDIIVLPGIEELFMQDITDFYIGAVEDVAFYFDILCPIRSFDTYINSGVLLINLKKWRQENISQKLFEAVEKYGAELYYLDQTAINLVCKGKIKLLELHYNVQVFILLQICVLLNHPLRKRLIQSIKKPKIIHYTGKKKPWNSYCPLRKYYLKYEKLTPFATDYDFKYKLKIFMQFIFLLLKDFYFILRFLLSPIIKISQKQSYFEITLFFHFKFKLFKQNSFS
ncbi:glycosyltransferase family 8 protein [Candidatus Ruminimicrobiellum ovillum]|uniref:glycosyltransferase family 8 protein n=1 Tax=Candidatus Ruminimicrobiellum ovillum TaxID=1947927 RepID=UPI00355AB4DF